MMLLGERVDEAIAITTEGLIGAISNDFAIWLDRTGLHHPQHAGLSRCAVA